MDQEAFSSIRKVRKICRKIQMLNGILEGERFVDELGLRDHVTSAIFQHGSVSLSPQYASLTDSSLSLLSPLSLNYLLSLPSF